MSIIGNPIVLSGGKEDKIDLSSITAGSEQILNGYTSVDTEGNPIIGTFNGYTIVIYNNTISASSVSVNTTTHKSVNVVWDLSDYIPDNMVFMCGYCSASVGYSSNNFSVETAFYIDELNGSKIGVSSPNSTYSMSQSINSTSITLENKQLTITAGESSSEISWSPDTTMGTISYLMIAYQ